MAASVPSTLMALEPGSPLDDAQAPLAGGQLHWLRAGRVEVALAPEAGGRIAQMRYDGVDWLVAEREGRAAAIGWGCYPMVPWAGRIRRGRFSFDGKDFVLPANLGAHAIHGVGFTRPWQIERLEVDAAMLSLALPEDRYWPFGGVATQCIRVVPDGVELRNVWFGSVGASVAAGESVVLASYDYRQSPNALVEDSQEVFGAFSTPISKTLNFTLYGSAGLSNGAPDYGVGAMVTVDVF